MVSIYIWLLLTCQCGYKCMRARACVCCVCLLPANGKVFSSLLYVIAFALLLFHLALPFPLPFSQQAHCLPTISQTISLSIYSYFFFYSSPVTKQWNIDESHFMQNKFVELEKRGKDIYYRFSWNRSRILYK